MKVTRTTLAIGTPVIIINDFGVACTVGMAVPTALVVVKLVILAATVVFKELTELIWLSKCEVI